MKNYEVKLSDMEGFKHKNKQIEQVAIPGAFMPSPFL